MSAEEESPSDVNLVASINGVHSSIAFQQDMSIREALRTLSDQFEINIVPSARVDGIIGFSKLRNVTFEEAMNAILGADFVYEQEGPVIRVYTQEEYQALMADESRMVHKVFTLYYITSEEAKRLIQPILSERGIIEASTPAEISLPTDESIAGTAGGDSVAVNDRIIVRDFPEKIVDVELLLETLDIRPKQVLVEATLMSARLNEETKFGIDWNSFEGETFSLTNPGAMTSGLASGITGTTGLTLGIATDHARAFIRALETVSDTTLLANPKILAVNKQLGQVYIGRRLGYRDAATIGVGGVATEGEVKFLETGTKLTFRAYIGNDGYIRMDIYPKDSVGELNAENVPDETSTEMATNIMVRDGETIIIGGLFRDLVTKSESRVPLFGSLPIVGPLFRGETDTTDREEMVILLTPHIIDNATIEGTERAVEDVKRKAQALNEARMPIGRVKLAQDCYEKACENYLMGNAEEALTNVECSLVIMPTFLQATRLKERIIKEIDPAAYQALSRKVQEEVKHRLEAMPES
jgi:type IV pilus assembly protein PilQ